MPPSGSPIEQNNVPRNDKESPNKRARKDTKSPESLSRESVRPACQDAEELLSHLTDDGWRDALKMYTSGPGFASLAKFVASER